MLLEMWFYGDFIPKTKLAMFDLDDTLIKCSADDVPSFRDNVIEKLQGIKDHNIIVITNQLLTFDGGKKEKNFKLKVDKFCEKVGRPMVVICCNGYNFARKPGTGALEHYLKELDYKEIEDSQANYSAIVQEMYGITLETYGNEKQFLNYFDYANSFYVGDAAGKGARPRTDDIGFAINVGVKFYTPEAYFENEMNDYQVKHIDMQKKRRSTGAATEETDDSTGDVIENYDYYETVFIHGGASLCGKHFFASKFVNAKKIYYNCNDEFLMKKFGKHEKTICCLLDYDTEVQRWLKNFCYLTGQKLTGTTESRVDTKKYTKYFTNFKNIKFEYDDSKYNEDQKKAARLFL